jgi:hypothetical protein
MNMVACVARREQTGVNLLMSRGRDQWKPL